MADIPTSAVWALWLPGTTFGGKEKEMDLELLCVSGVGSRNKVSEWNCSTPSGFRNRKDFRVTGLPVPCIVQPKSTHCTKTCSTSLSEAKQAESRDII